MTLFVLDERTVPLLGAAYRHPTDLTRSSARSQRKREEGGEKKKNNTVPQESWLNTLQGNKLYQVFFLCFHSKAGDKISKDA